MKMKKTVSWILSMMMVFTMIPALGTAAHAEDGGTPAISIGAGNIEKGNKVYMGVRLSKEYPYNEIPISWIVLGGANSSDLKIKHDRVVSSENARLLITEKTQGNVEFDPYGQSNTWQGSNIQDWCSQFITGKDLGQDPVTHDDKYREHFNGYEQDAMLQTSKTDAEYATDEDEGLEWGTSSLNDEQLFLLSAEEVSDDYGYFNGSESRKAYQHDMDDGIDWWLRSPHRDVTQGAAIVKDFDGNVDGGDVRDKHGVRPACNLVLTSVLFTSAAVGGKNSGEVGPDALTAISGNTTNEWKLTLNEGKSVFEASAAAGAMLEMEKGYSGWGIPLVYSGAGIKDNEYVSVILCDSKGIAKYYGNIAQKKPAGEASVNIPAGLAAGKYMMYVFKEGINGDKMTDYASDFSTIELMVKGPVHNVTVNNGTADKESFAEGESVTITADEPESGKRFKAWTGVDGLTFTSGNASTATATFTMPDKDVTVTATYEDISAVSTPVFSPEGGTYTSAQNVTISCATDGADIYYTADGTDPTTDSTQYTGAIPVGSTATIKAIAVKSGKINSAVASAAYTIENVPAPPEPIRAVIPTGKTLTYNGKIQTGVAAGTGYTLSGTVSAGKAGSYKATAALNDGYVWSDGTTEAKAINWKINKAANPLKIGAKTATVKYSKLKKKAQALAVTKVIKFTKQLKDKKTYTLSSAKKGSKSFRKYFKINKTSGNVTVKKGLKKGTYKVKVKVNALGNSNYKASAAKTVTFTVRVK